MSRPLLIKKRVFCKIDHGFVAPSVVCSLLIPLLALASDDTALFHIAKFYELRWAASTCPFQSGIFIAHPI